MRPNRPTSQLDRLRADFAERGWHPDDLRQFRMAGDGDAAEAGDADGDDGDSGEAGDADKLGDAGQRALIAERDKARKARNDLKPWTAMGRDLGMTPDQVREALAAKKGDDNAADLAKIQRDADRNATERANGKILRAEVKALAAETFADPADAPLYLNLSDFTVDDDGEVDTDEINTALAAVLVKKPHLAKSKGGVRPDPSQGSRGIARKDVAPGLGRLAAAYEANSK